MSDIRRRHAETLLTAALRLDPVDVRTDAAPQLNLGEAYDAALGVWQGMVNYGTGQERRALRIALLGVKSIRDAVVSGRPVPDSDNETIRQAAAAMRSVAKLVWPASVAPKTVNEGHSPVGLRLHSMSELAGARPFVVLPSAPLRKDPVVLRASQASSDPVDEDIRRLSALESFRSKLPKNVPNGEPFVMVHMPLIVYTKKALNYKALARAGIKFFELRNYGPQKETNVVDKKIQREKGWAYIFENQLVVGMRPDEVDDRKGKPKGDSRVVVVPDGDDFVPLKTLDSRLRRLGFKRDTGAKLDLTTNVRGAKIVCYRGGSDVKYVIVDEDDRAVEGHKQSVKVRFDRDVSTVPGAASRAVAFVSKRLGHHTNPLDGTSSRLVRSPGSHVAFMWLLPDHAVSALGTLVISEAAFPWRQAESLEQRDKRLRDARRELHTLEEQQAILLKHKQAISQRDLQRISELREILDRSDARPVETPAQKRERLARLTAELDDEMRSKYAALYTELDEIAEKLADEADKKERSALVKRRSQIQKQLTDARELLMIKYRRKK